MTPTQFLLILRVHWLVALLTLLLVVGATAVFTWLQDRQYTATASVVLDVKSPDPVSGMMLAGLMAPAYMATQSDIIQSARVARAVVTRLRLDQHPNVRTQWAEATGGAGTPTDWLAGALRRNLDVRPSRASNVIEIAYQGTDPAFVAAMANAFAQSYIDVSIEMRATPAREYASFFNEQTQTARERLQAAQKALTEFQQVNRITASAGGLDFETVKLNEISSQLTVLRAQITDSQSKRQRGASDTVAEVIQNPLINTLKADITRLEARLDESSVHLGKNHPQIQRMESELDTFRTQLAVEKRKITSSIETSYQVGRQREGQLQAALAAQKTRVLELNRQRDQIDVMRQEIESAQRLFDTVGARAAQSHLESQNYQTNIAILSPALPPLVPSSPQTSLNLLIAVFAGTLLGLALALAIEMTNRRVRSREDLSNLPDLPLLGALGAPKRFVRLTGAGAGA